MKKHTLFTDSHFNLSGTANLSVKNGPAGMVHFTSTTTDGFLAHSCEITGARKLLDAARYESRATLGLVGAKIRVEVYSRVNTNGVFIESAPIFRAIAARAKMWP
jgi:hypothetical protein